jgi:hypothetical protein
VTRVGVGEDVRPGIVVSIATAGDLLQCRGHEALSRASAGSLGRASRDFGGAGPRALRLASSRFLGARGRGDPV